MDYIASSLFFVFLLIVAILISVRYHHRLQQVYSRLNDYQRRLDRYQCDNESLRRVNDTLRCLGRDFAEMQDAPATYHVHSFSAGYFAVIRRCTLRHKQYDLVIKRFTNPDTSLNLLEAETLCDKLNEKN